MPMMGLQEWIHKLEEGDGVKYVKIGTLLLGLLGLLAIYDLREYKNYSNPEAMEAAQLARNIARGQGYTTQCVRPLAFYLLNQKDPGTKWLEKPTPDVSTPPVYPVLLAGLMKVMPMQYTIINPSMFVNFQPERIISFMNQAFFLAAIYLVFLLGRRLFDPQVGCRVCGV